MTVLFDLEFPNAREGIFVPQGFATPHEVVDVVVRGPTIYYSEMMLFRIMIQLTRDNHRKT